MSDAGSLAWGMVVDGFRPDRYDMIGSLVCLAGQARAWIAPFRASFSDLDPEIELIAEDDAFAARFVCSGTHTGEWLGHAPTGRRFRSVPEVYFFHVTEGPHQCLELLGAGHRGRLTGSNLRRI